MRTVHLLLPVLVSASALVGTSCATKKDPEAREAVKPVSQHSSIPWNSVGPSGAGAQFSAMPGAKERR